MLHNSSTRLSLPLETDICCGQWYRWHMRSTHFIVHMTSNRHTHIHIFTPVPNEQFHNKQKCVHQSHTSTAVLSVCNVTQHTPHHTLLTSTPNTNRSFAQTTKTSKMESGGKRRHATANCNGIQSNCDTHNPEIKHQRVPTTTDGV